MSSRTPSFEKSMNEATTNPNIRCPLCGSNTEVGYIDIEPGKLFRWYAGEPKFDWKNMTKRALPMEVSSALGFGGEVIGGWGIGDSPFLKGIFCRSCSHIVLQLDWRSSKSKS
jgi:DNA-directed RNA polymerase subunit RPC12/RpoP